MVCVCAASKCPDLAKMTLKGDQNTYKSVECNIPGKIKHRTSLFSPALCAKVFTVYSSVVDTNTLNLVLDPEFWLNLVGM